jgi:hypothetical protein
MSELYKCPKCKKYSFSKSCECRIFRFIDEDGEEYEARGEDLNEAVSALGCGREADADYYLAEVEPHSVPFTVIDAETGEKKKILIHAQTTTEYFWRDDD